MKIVVAALLLAALVFGGAGAASLGLDWRLATLVPGGLTAAALRYDPFTGRLEARGLEARDAAGRVIFRATAVRARADAVALLSGTLALRQVVVEEPFGRLDVAPGPALAALGGVPRSHVLSLEGVVVTGGTLVLERARHGGRPLELRDIDVRLNHLAADGSDLAFAVDMAVYGSLLRITGQAVRALGADGAAARAGYAVRVRGRDLDIAAALRDFPLAAAVRLERGRGDVDATVLLVDGAPLVSGQLRLGPMAAHVDEPGIPSLVADGAVLALDRFDAQALSGAVSRLELVAPRLETPSIEEVTAALHRLAARLDAAGVVVRRVGVTRGAVRVGTTLRLRDVHVTAHASGPSADAPWTVAGRAAFGRDGAISTRGLLARDLGGLDVLVRARGVEATAWPELLPVVQSTGTNDFEGRVRVGRAPTPVTRSAQVVSSREPGAAPAALPAAVVQP